MRLRRGWGSVRVVDLPLPPLASWGLTAFDLAPTALRPLPEVCGGDDQIQRGSGGLP